MNIKLSIICSKILMTRNFSFVNRLGIKPLTGEKLGRKTERIKGGREGERGEGRKEGKNGGRK